MENYHLAIVGGGMVGAALAVGLAQQGKRVALIESKPPEPFDSEQPLDLRVSAISKTSVDLLQSLGVWSQVEAMRLTPYRHLQTWESLNEAVSFSSDALDLLELGFMVENRVIQLALWDAFRSLPSLICFSSSNISEYQLGKQTVLRLDSGEQITCDWLCGADGANSHVRAAANIGVTSWDYRQHCMLINVKTDGRDGDTTWQQFFPSGPRSFLPMGGNNASLAWYDSPQRIKQLMMMPLDKLELEIEQCFPERLGSVHVVDRGAFPLTRRHAQQYVRSSAVLFGDAAHTIHPLAGQGVNLGFKDVADFLQRAQSESTVTQAICQQYASARRKDNLIMQTAMDAFYLTFSNQLLPLKVLRNAGLFLAERAGPAKLHALKYALGQA